jgi:hypothetical protein
MPFRILWWKSRPLGLRYLALKQMGFSPGGETPYFETSSRKARRSPQQSKLTAEGAEKGRERKSLAEFQKGI